MLNLDTNLKFLYLKITFLPLTSWFLYTLKYFFHLIYFLYAQPYICLLLDVQTVQREQCNQNQIIFKFMTVSCPFIYHYFRQT